MNQAYIGLVFRRLPAVTLSAMIRRNKNATCLSEILTTLVTIRSARNPIVFSPYWGGDYVGLSGSARTLDPTNKNYAPELSTFGTIIEVNRSEVQWTSLSLEKLPSWSQLISAPGKYELLVRDFRLWALCINCGGSRFGKSRNTSLVFSRPGL